MCPRFSFVIALAAINKLQEMTLEYHKIRRQNITSFLIDVVLDVAVVVS